MELFSRAEAARSLNISAPTFDKLIANNEIAYVEIGKRKMFRREEIESYVTRKTKYKTPTQQENND